jgi:ABC-2 type transport system permease protein
MLNSFFSKALYDTRKALFWWSIAFLILNLWVIALYPYIMETFPMGEYLENMPPGMKVFIGEAVDLATIEGFLSVELFNFFLPLLVLVYTISQASGIIGEEEENGTLDLVLAQPVARWRMIVEKFASLFTFVLITLAASFLGLLIGAGMIETEVEVFNLFLATMNIIPFTLLMASIALFLTAVGLRRSLAAGVTGALAAATYLLNTLSPLADLPKVARQISPWYYYGGGNSITAGLDWGNIAILLAGMIMLLLISLWAFQRRDVGV